MWRFNKILQHCPKIKRVQETGEVVAKENTKQEVYICLHIHADLDSQANQLSENAPECSMHESRSQSADMGFNCSIKQEKETNKVTL